MANTRQAQRWARRGTTTQRGLGAPHQKRKDQLVPAALGTMCPGPWHGPRSPRCVGVMTSRRQMNLDEDPPRAVAPPVRWRICCEACNKGAGARLGNRRRAKVVKPVWSRAW